MLFHSTSRLCKASSRQAIQHLSEQAGMSRWILGLWDCQEVAAGLFKGASLFDGGVGYLRAQVDEEAGTVIYHIGASLEALVPRIRASVMRGETIGYAVGTCIVSLEAWRVASMDEERWQRLVCAHEAEIELIKAQLEALGNAH